MALRVVGTGLGRTGTKSMQTALNMLGVGPCHHMVEVFQRPESMEQWIAAAAGQPDWDAIFEGYHAVVDNPGAAHWRALVAYYPEARVLHTVRDADSWFDSTQATIFAPDSGALSQGPAMPFFRTVIDVFGDTEAVIAEVPAERLLVFQVGEGWDRLCPFLGVPVPAEPYPSENSREAFQTRTKALADAAIQSLDDGAA